MWTPGHTITLSSFPVYSYTHSRNKLRVLLCPIENSEVCGYMRAVHAGSKDEDACVPTGAAHFIEHMSFRIQDGKIWTLASKGDVINAETNMDSTRFYIVHLPHQTAETIQIDANRFKQSTVPAAKVPIERNAVLNELERGKRAANQMFQTTSAVAILEHPYHHSTIGTRADVNRTTAADMARFRGKYYVPNNTTLIFSGKFDPQAVLAQVDTHFGTMLATKLEESVPLEPAQHGKRTVELELEAPCPMICMAFRQPKGSTKESLVLQCISKLIWHNNAGRAKHLIDDGTLHDVSTYAPRQKEAYLWFLHGTMEGSSNMDVAESKMMDMLQSFSLRKVAESRLESIKKSMKDEWTRSVESVTDVMNELGRGVSMGNWKDCADRQVALETITTTDIKSISNLLFRPHRLTVTRLVPTKHRHKSCTTTPIAKKNNVLSPPVKTLKVHSSPKKGWKVTSVGTTNILHVPRANYVRVTLSARFSPAHHDLASLLVANLSDTGKSVSSRLMDMHTERNFYHDHEFIHMSMSMPTTKHVLKQASGMVLEHDWNHPDFSRRVLELKKRHMISELMSLKTDQSHVCKSNFIKSLFQRTLYHMPIDSRIRRIGQLSLRDVQKFHRDSVGQTSYVTIVTPDTDSATLLNDIFPSGSRPQTTLAWTAAKRQSMRIHKELPGCASFQIMMGQTVSVRKYSPEAIALQCASEILGGGMTGRLMHTVREQRGLGTYGLYAVVKYISPKTDAIFCIQGTFSPDSVEKGMACTRQLLDEWHQNGITPNELQNAKDRIIGSHIIATDSVDELSDTTLKYAIEGKNPNTAFEEFQKSLQKLTLVSVNKTLKALIDPSRMVEVVVGPTVGS